MQTNQFLKYRPDIDGLRSIAVLSVLAFHAFPSWFKGGFVGVDIFFVISGFLISRIIFHGIEKNDFSYLAFYIRRIKRIFPALILVLLGCLIVGWFTMLPDDYSALGKNVVGGAGFFANLALWRDSGYFNSPTEFNPLAHLWSLGIEEQFYLVWPLLIAVCWKQTRIHLVILVILLGSFFLNYILISIKPSATFYFPITRFWELLMGSILAYWLEFKKKETISLLNRLHITTTLQKLISETLVWLGCVLILLSILLINKETAFPGAWALLPTIGAFFIIAAGPYAWLSRKIFASQPCVFIGLISYPLYLWHWPILAFLKTEYGDISLSTTFIAILSSVVLAWLTFKWIETPIRFGRFNVIKSLILFLLMFFVGYVGLLVMQKKLINHRYDEQRNYLQYFNKDTLASNYFIAHDILRKYKDECSFSDDKHRSIKTGIPSSCFLSKTKKKIFLWGDSHAQQYNYGLSKELPKNISILQVATSGCKPSLPDRYPDKQKVCNISNKFALEKIKAIQPDLVIMAQVNEHESNHWRQIIASLKKNGIQHIIIMGPVPGWNRDLYKIIARSYWKNTPDRLRMNLDNDILRTDKIMKSEFMKPSENIKYVSLIDHLCNKNGCMTYLDGNKQDGIFTFDNGHLTPLASDYVVKNILMPVISNYFEEEIREKKNVA